jgi:hypothetical protein
MSARGSRGSVDQLETFAESVMAPMRAGSASVTA